VNTELGTSVALVFLAAVAGVAMPALGMWGLMPSLEDGSKTTRNYRGVEIGHGLGVVWLIWAVSVLAFALASIVLSGVMGEGIATMTGLTWSAGAVLVLAAFAFGLIDDVFGNADVRGFRGHLRAMARGRLTTGGLKLVGIGVASAVAGAVGSLLAVQTGWGALAPWWVHWIMATPAIALSANLVNLTDLRPGRALKVYVLLAGIAIEAMAASAWLMSEGTGISRALTVALIASLLTLGPVLAVWRYDLGERGMLGDAGANAMGALAGFLLASSLPIWGLGVYLVVVLALNILSEKVSFSRVIEGNALLRWIDGLGRLKDVDTRKDGGI
jgi:UDP-GlcNAc:undecaprenyl-phosphate GlcNAc-1-phosphate transferase